MTDRDTTQTDLQLTDEQFAFMQAHREQVERACIAHKLGSSEPIEAIINLDDYKRLFGHMSWDDVYDRYQATPGYDWSLRKALHEQLQSDFEAGRVKVSSSMLEDSKSGAGLSDNERKQLGLKRIDASDLFDE